MSLLEVDQLSVDLVSQGSPVRVLDRVELAIEAGEVHALVGESGSGKSLTALSVARLLPSTLTRRVGGTVRFDGEDVYGLDGAGLRRLRGRGVGYVFQEPSTALNPVMRIGNQILEMLRLHRPEEATDAVVWRWLERVGIPSPDVRARQYPHELSGGMQQRVMLALALSAQPRLLIADEPTTALDVTIQAQVLDLVRSLQRELGMAVLLITHNFGLVGEIADRVSVMYAGQVVERGSVADVLKAPRHPYTAALLGSVPRLGDVRESLVVIPGSVPSPGHWPEGCRFHPRCSRAMPGCALEEPVWRGVGSERWVRCPFPVEVKS
jgi:oligopeptide/dipeptide ABC transporter ATP-binding protein